MKRTLTLVLCVLPLAFVACEEKSAPTTPTTPKSTTPTPAAGGMQAPAPNEAPASPPPAAPDLHASVKVMGLEFTVPTGWQAAPPASQMRLAEMHVPAADNDVTKSCSVVFSTAGGDVASNINRWIGQVGDQKSKPEPKTSQVGGMNATTIEIVGTFAGMGGDAHTDWMLRGTIVETPGGLLFIKMTGPSKEMTAAGDAYNAMLAGAKKH